MIKEALMYAKKGWYVFPLAPQSKLPFKGSNGFKNSTNKQVDIKRIWEKNSNANIGIETGEISNLFVLDVDDKENGNGVMSQGSLSLKMLEEAHSELPPTVQLLTPSKSKQLWFQMPDDVHISISAGKLGDGLDIRANGGYTLAPPSFVKKTDKYLYSGAYEWYTDQSPDEIPLSKCPQWLVDLLIVEEPDFSLFSSKGRSTLDIDCREILNKYKVKGLKSSKDGKIIYGSHPLHGSSNGQNFFIDIEKGLWHCFRHNTGGNALSLIALLEGTLECHQCVKKALRGKEYKSVLNIAVKHFNFDSKSLYKDEKGVIWDRNSDCSLKPTFNNCMNFLEKDTNFKNIFYNTFCSAVFYNNEYLQDEHVLEAKTYLRKSNFEPSKAILDEAIISHSLNNKKNPITEYLDSLKWDGKKRLDKWLIDYCGAEDNELIRKISKMTLTAGVYRAYEPGTKYDFMLLLEGKQGIKKSMLIETLSGKEFYSEANLLDKQKDIILQIKGGWFVEVAELEAFGKADINSLKAFIVRKIDEQRFAYNKHISRIPRSFILIGSINPETSGYLRDKTGNRRFLPVEVNELDIKGVEKDRDQLFAEAVLAYKEKFSLYFTDDEKHLLEMAREQQKMREVYDEWISSIYGWIHTKKGDIGNSVTCMQIWKDHFCKKEGELKNAESRRIGDCLISLGAERPKKATRINGVLGRFFNIQNILEEMRKDDEVDCEKKCEENKKVVDKIEKDMEKIEWD